MTKKKINPTPLFNQKSIKSIKSQNQPLQNQNKNCYNPSVTKYKYIFSIKGNGVRNGEWCGWLYIFYTTNRLDVDWDSGGASMILVD